MGSSRIKALEHWSSELVLLRIIAGPPEVKGRRIGWQNESQL
jgi:hypothetical protein